MRRINRKLRILILVDAVLFGLLCTKQSTVEAQTSLNPNAAAGAVAGAPKASPLVDTHAKSARSETGNISGTVLDTNGDVVQGATVKLSGQSGSDRSVVSGDDGQYTFAGIPPDTYRITVTGAGMNTFHSSQIQLAAGEFYIVPPIKLSVSAATVSVTVSGNKEELSQEQVRIAVQQRIGGIIPNFYSSYDWNAPPMQAKQKLQLGLRSVIDPVSFLAVAGIAGAEQYQNVFPEFGGGIEGYGKRYGAAMANHVSATMLSRAVYPSLFHQDPRYFYKGTGTIRSRAFYAMSAAVMARNDDGRWAPNYSNVLGNFSAAAISELYYPDANRGASLVVFNGLANTAADAASNLLREFVLKKITSHVPKSTDGQP